VLRAKQRVNERGITLTAHRGRRRANGRREAATEGFDDGGGSGGAPVSSGRGCHGCRGRIPAATRACQAPSDPKSQGKQAGGLALHRRRRIDGDGGDPRRQRGEISARACSLAGCRGKGRHRDACASLKRTRGWKARRVGVGTAGGLPLMAAAITARVKRWKETVLIDHGKVNCLK
jgi:hypothetical protein